MGGIDIKKPSGDAAAVDLNTTHRTSDGSDHGFIDQLVVSDSSPTFQGINITDVKDTRQVHIPIRNDSGGALNAGDPLYITGYNSGQDRVTVDIADSDDPAKMPSIGILEQDLTNNQNGFSVKDGHLVGSASENIDTSSWTVGTDLYVSITGTLTDTKPTGTAQIQKIAEVTRQHATLGALMVFGAGRTNDVPNVRQISLTDASTIPVPMALEKKTHAIGSISQDSDLSEMSDQIRGGEMIIEMTADGSIRTLTLNANYHIGGGLKVLTFAANEKKVLYIETNGTNPTVTVVHGAA